VPAQSNPRISSTLATCPISNLTICEFYGTIWYDNREREVGDC